MNTRSTHFSIYIEVHLPLSLVDFYPNFVSYFEPMTCEFLANVTVVLLPCSQVHPPSFTAVSKVVEQIILHSTNSYHDFRSNSHLKNSHFEDAFLRHRFSSKYCPPSYMLKSFNGHSRWRNFYVRYLNEWIEQLRFYQIESFLPLQYLSNKCLCLLR